MNRAKRYALVLLLLATAPARGGEQAPAESLPPPAAPGPADPAPAPSQAPTPRKVKRLPPELRGPGGSPPMSEREEPATDAEADAMLDTIMPKLAAASVHYEDYARKFTCTERVRTVNYSWSQQEANSEKSHDYAYLLLFDEERSRYDVLRNPVGDGGLPERREVVLDVSAPDAYAWTFLFSPRTQRVMHYFYMGREIKDYRLCHVIQFESPVPVVEGRDVREWTGTVWVEDGTWNFVRIEAAPSFQDRRLAGQWRLYVESFNLPWGKLKPRPRGQEIEVEFNYLRDNLLFPTRVDLREFVWTGRGSDTTDSRLILEYRDYRFFQTGAEVIESAPSED